ncbi:MAG: N-ATPase subunit AtpR [Pirellulaceae bacterium]
MHDGGTLLLAWFAGLLLGLFFYGGLLWTVRKGVSSQRPALWFVGSMFLRVSLVVVGFYWIGQGHWERLLICLLGFIIARLTVTRLAGPPIQLGHLPTKEARHASKS